MAWRLCPAHLLPPVGYGILTIPPPIRGSAVWQPHKHIHFNMLGDLWSLAKRCNPRRRSAPEGSLGFPGHAARTVLARELSAIPIGPGPRPGHSDHHDSCWRHLGRTAFLTQPYQHFQPIGRAKTQFRRHNQIKEITAGTKCPPEGSIIPIGPPRRGFHRFRRNGQEDCFLQLQVAIFATNLEREAG